MNLRLALLLGVVCPLATFTAQAGFCAASYVNVTTNVVEGGTISGVLRRQLVTSSTDCSPGSGNCASGTTYRLMFYPTGGFLTSELSGATWHNDHWDWDLANTVSGDNPFSINLVQNTDVQPDRVGVMYISFPPTDYVDYHVWGITCLTQEVWVSVMDDDRPIAALPVGNGIQEGSSGTMFRIYKSGSFYASDLPRTINFTLSGSTAQSGTDFTSIGSSVVIPSGSDGYAEISVVALADTALEGAEAIKLTLTAGTGYTLGTPVSATNYIYDDYATVTVKATDGYASELGGDTGTFTISRSGNTNKAITVSYNVSGTAAAGSDCTALPGTVTLPIGVLATNLTVTPISGGGTEPAETVVLTLQSNSSYALGLETSAVVTIAGEGANPRDELPTGERYVRGGGTNSSLYSMVIPLDGLRGAQRGNIEGTNSYSPWRYHYDGGSTGDQAYATNRIEYNTPLASFGSDWGAPMYLGQSYSMGLYHGEPTGDPLLILVFQRPTTVTLDNWKSPFRTSAAPRIGPISARTGSRAPWKGTG